MIPFVLHSPLASQTGAPKGRYTSLSTRASCLTPRRETCSGGDREAAPPPACGAYVTREAPVKRGTIRRQLPRALRSNPKNPAGVILILATVSPVCRSPRTVGHFACRLLTSFGACGSLPPLLASLHPPAEGRRERRSVVPPSLAPRSPVVLRPPDRCAAYGECRE